MLQNLITLQKPKSRWQAKYYLAVSLGRVCLLELIERLIQVGP